MCNLIPGKYSHTHRSRDPSTNTVRRMRTAIIVEMGMGTRMGTGTGMRIGSGRAEKRRRSARNRTRLVDVMWETGEISVERGKNVRKKGLVQ